MVPSGLSLRVRRNGDFTAPATSARVRGTAVLRLPVLRLRDRVALGLRRRRGRASDDRTWRIPPSRFSPGWIAAGNVLAIAVAAALAAVGAPGWTLLVPALATVPLTLLTIRHAL